MQNNKYITRQLENVLGDYLMPNKVIVIYGPRQVGKTTLVKHFLNKTKKPYKYFIGDDINVKKTLSLLDSKNICEFFEQAPIIAIDEAQYIPNIGRALKIAVDMCNKPQIIVTGSSSFELAGQIGEPLVGRKWTFHLYPISIMELNKQYYALDLNEKLDEFLIYGMYPAVLTTQHKSKKIQILQDLVNSYLFKDILMFERLKHPLILVDLLKLLAYQVGSLVSYTELANTLDINLRTVMRYLDLLQKAFIIFELRGLSYNMRTEISKKRKYYFYDNGILNAIINNFNKLETRNDTGKLWENFLVTERIKLYEYTRNHANFYFWRTWQGYEIDWIEEKNGKYHAFEFKYNKPKKTHFNHFIQTYPNSSFEVITKHNWLEFCVKV